MRPGTGPAPSVVPGRAARPADGKIEIRAGGAVPEKSATKRARKTDPAAFWRRYYKGHDEAPDEVLARVAAYRVSKDFKAVEEVLRYYLAYHGDQAQPWMYEGLAVTMELNGRTKADVKTALDYAAQLARKSRNPADMVVVADLYMVRGYHSLAAPLLDAASEALPHYAEPALMSMKLAFLTRDPRRMSLALEHLLALGWPRIDAELRAKAREAGRALADAFRKDGRTAEADSLERSLEQAETRDVVARLTWSGDGDLDLVVKEPLGATASFLTPRTVFGGALVKNGRSRDAEEIYSCPRGFDGDYTFSVTTVYSDEKDPVRDVRLEVITHEGQEDERRESRTITLNPPTTVVVTLKNGRRTRVLPFDAPPVPTPAPGRKPETTAHP